MLKQPAIVNVISELDTVEGVFMSIGGEMRDPNPFVILCRTYQRTIRFLHVCCSIRSEVK